MQAIQISSTGGPEVLALCEIPVPTPGPDEALIRVEACGVNFIDIYLREGRYPASLPNVPGQEAAGIIESVGFNVSTVKVGDRVAWCSLPGTYAQYAVAPATRLVPVPDEVTLQQAAAAMLQGMTAHYLANSSYPIHEGDEVLIHAGAGGTGLLLTQIAKFLGARVITTVSTEEKATLSRSAGADAVILYTHADFAAEVRRLTQGRGVAAVYDSVGKSTFEGSLTCLRPRGTLVLFGGASGPVPPFDLIRLSTLGSLYVTRPTLKDFIVTRADLLSRATDILQSVGAGTLKLRIEHTYPLADAAQAHRDLESRGTTGKLLLIT
jgi:NADPH2:quinone reductase